MNVDPRACGGNAEDMGETCGGGIAVDESSTAIDVDVVLALGCAGVAGVCADDAILPMYHDYKRELSGGVVEQDKRRRLARVPIPCLLRPP